MGLLVNNENFIAKEIQRRRVLSNSSYFRLQKKFESKLLSRATKSLLYKTLVVLVLLYASGTRVLAEALRMLWEHLRGKYLSLIHI